MDVPLLAPRDYVAVGSAAVVLLAGLVFALALWLRSTRRLAARRAVEAARLEERLQERTAEIEHAHRRLGDVAADAERGRARLSLIQGVSEALKGGSEPAELLERLARLAVPSFSDRCVVYAFVAGGRLRPIASVAPDPSHETRLREGRHLASDDARSEDRIAARVIRSGKAELHSAAPDRAAAAEDEAGQSTEDRLGFASNITVPLLPRGHLAGAISFTTLESGRHYAAEDLDVACALAKWAALAADHTRLSQTERVRSERVEKLRAASTALAGAGDLSAVVRAVLAVHVDVLGAGWGVLALADGGAALEVVDTTGEPRTGLESGRRISLAAETPLGDAVRGGAPVFVESAAAWEQRYPSADERDAASPRPATAALPLRIDGGRAMGAVVLGFGAERTFGAEERATASEMARLGAEALERAQLREAAGRARAEAEAASRAKAEFLDVMNHELRTPLNAIGGYAELIETGVYGPVTEAQAQNLARIRRSQKQLLSLIGQILNHTRIEAGQVRYEPADVLVDRMLANVSALMEPRMLTKRLVYTYHGCDPALSVHMDRDKVEQILLNLLSNAAKFTPEEGRVEVDCGGDARSVRIRVRDSGRGIPAGKIPSIFDPFVQADTGHARSAEGVGLGLSISRSLARAMGGDLSVQSVEGKGSSFTLTLPRHPGEEASSPGILARIASAVRWN
jgi:signal transduction histidine kinase